MKHRVKFEIYGKYLQVDITSNSKEEAKEIVRNRIKFYSVEKVKLEDDKEVKFFKNLFGID